MASEPQPSGANGAHGLTDFRGQRPLGPPFLRVSCAEGPHLPSCRCPNDAGLTPQASENLPLAAQASAQYANPKAGGVSSFTSACRGVTGNERDRKRRRKPPTVRSKDPTRDPRCRGSRLALLTWRNPSAMTGSPARLDHHAVAAFRVRRGGDRRRDPFHDARPGICSQRDA